MLELEGTILAGAERWESVGSGSVLQRSGGPGEVCLGMRVSCLDLSRASLAGTWGTNVGKQQRTVATGDRGSELSERQCWHPAESGTGGHASSHHLASGTALQRAHTDATGNATRASPACGSCQRQGLEKMYH